MFPYYIEDPSKLSHETLTRLERYQILADLNSEAYYSNCFIYALRQSGLVLEDVISYIKSHFANTHITTKKIRFLGKRTELSFIPYEVRHRSSKTNALKVQKLGKKKNSYTIGAKNVMPIPLLIFKNHWMLYDEDIVYQGKKYNTFRFLDHLIKEGTLKPITINDVRLIKSKCDVYLKTPAEIKLSEFNPVLFDFRQCTGRRKPFPIKL